MASHHMFRKAIAVHEQPHVTTFKMKLLFKFGLSVLMIEAIFNERFIQYVDANVEIGIDVDIGVDIDVMRVFHLKMLFTFSVE